MVYIVSLRTEGGKRFIVIKGDKAEHTFGWKDWKGIGDFFVKLGGVPSYMTFSSDCDFPEDVGFPTRYNTRAIFTKAVEYMRIAMAVRVPKMRLTRNTPERVQKLVKGKRFPLYVCFPKLARDGKDVTLPFNSADEFTQFCNGIHYAKRLVETAG